MNCGNQFKAALELLGLLRVTWHVAVKMGVPGDWVQLAGGMTSNWSPTARGLTSNRGAVEAVTAPPASASIMPIASNGSTHRTRLICFLTMVIGSAAAAEGLTLRGKVR